MARVPLRVGGGDTDKAGGTWGGAARTRLWGLRDPLSPLLPPLPGSPLRVPAPRAARPAAAAPAPGQGRRREGAATHRLCRSQRLCRRGRGGGAFPPPASPWTARPAAAAPPSPASLAQRPTDRPTDRPLPGPLRGMGLGRRGEGTSRSWDAQVQPLPPPHPPTPPLPWCCRPASDPSPPAHQPGWQPSTAFPKVLSACRFNPEYPQACTSRHGVVAVTSQSIQALLQLKSKSKFKSLPQVDSKINPTLEASSRVSHHHHRPGPVQCHDFRTVTATVSPAPGNHRCFQGVLLRNVTSSMG